jgi:hypothetical protein
MEEVYVSESGKAIDLQKSLIAILKSCLETLKKDFIKATNDRFPLTTPDLTEMSNAELHSTMKNLPSNFASDYVWDLLEIRRILAAFGHHSRLRVLRMVNTFKNVVKQQPFYKGF